MSRSKAKGTAAESAVVACLRENGFPHAERHPLHGSKDVGDVNGVPGVVLEIKNAARMELGQWVDEARREAANAGVDVFVVVHKRRGKGSPLDWYATMPVSVLLELIR